MKHGLEKSLKNFAKKQILASMLGLLLILILSVLYNYLYLSGQAENTVRLISRMIQTKDNREVVLTLQDARLEHFKVIRYVSDDPSRSFTLPEIADLVPSSGWVKSLSEDHIELPIVENGQQRARVIFEFSRFSYVPYGMMIWILLNLVSLSQTRLMKKKIIAQYEKDIASERQQSRLEIANIVRHNVRTPLSALLRLSDVIEFKQKEESDIFRSIIGQIRDLVAKLDVEPAQNVKGIVNPDFYETTQLALAEIRLTVPAQIKLSLLVDDSIPSVIVDFLPVEFRSILTNLVNNAVEAIPGLGSVSLSVNDLGHSVEILITDTGKGIPPELLSRIKHKGFSAGKSQGSGLGLYHASSRVEDWGGHLLITSEVGVGTTVKVSLPIEARQPWYVFRLKIKSDSIVIVVDDQIVMHRLWTMKLRDAGFEGQILCFYDQEEMKTGVSFEMMKDAQFMVDYDLGENKVNGIELLAGLPDTPHRFLVTGHHDHKEIINSCEQKGLFLIPKTAIASLPIIIA